MIPKNHPRYESLLLRDKVKNAFLDGYLADSGMIAHGRGETFDYLLGEKTVPAAEESMKAAVASLLLAEHPVLSVNGNTTALVIDEVIELAKATDSKIEINLFYRTEERVDKITKLFKEHGYEDILGTNYDDLYYFDKITNPRATASRQGIYIADVILVPLEDGDRAELLKEAGKKIICIDLNPLSRTSKMSDISIVDNVVRAIPEMTRLANEYKNKDEDFLLKIVNDFNNEENLKDSLDSFKIKE
ncbi:MAG: 4-phosphopantoate--beta-alanine ligase [Methanobrevibacter sp.]